MSQKIFQKVKLIYNPGSGKNRDTDSTLEEVTRLLSEQNLDLNVSIAHPKGKITRIAKKAAKKGYRLVIAVGGDGTVEAVARGLVGTRARLGVLPLGSYNNVARSLGIPEDLKQACALFSGEWKTEKIDVGRLQTRKKKSFYFFELAAVGLTAALYPKVKNVPKGEWSGIKAAIDTLVRYPNPAVTLTLDGQNQAALETLLVTVANTPSFGVHFEVAPDASIQDGLLDVCVYPGLNKPGLLEYFASVAGSEKHSDKRVQRYQAKKIKIRSRPRLKIMADGRIFGKGTVRIRVKPGALRVVVPIKESEPALEAVAAPQNEPAPVSPG